jgi:molecular chaperone GrpE
MGGEVLNPWKGRRSEDGEPVADPEAEQQVDVDQVDQDVPDDPEAAAAHDEADAEDAETSVEEELEELQDRYLRLAAEFENFRKRTRRERSEARTLAQADLALQILPTLDDLTRVASTPHESTTVEALDEGIELILRNLRKQLEDAGLSPIEALDQPFDPELHQAIMTAETGDPELDDTVSRVFVEGFAFLGRLVRPAQVEVRRFVAESEPDDES